MAIKDGFSDFMLVDESGRIEYFYIPIYDEYDFRPEELIGTRPQQQYNNLYDETSTLMNAVTHGTTTKDYAQELVTTAGRRIRQVSDTFCLRAKGEVIGAIEFAYYDDSYASSKRGKSVNDRRSKPARIDDMIGASEIMTELRRKFTKVINLESPILLTGETGTGKEMAARIIHNTSKRCDREFVYVNCSALPENLLEGILFGIRRGSFTDAEEKEGLFNVANKGTLFLDEINSMPAATQGKILRAIEEKRIRPVGGEEEISVDVRIIASCNTKVDDLLYDKSMRKDLYFRLSVIQFELPPLRERKGDIKALTKSFIDELNEWSTGKGIKGIDSEADKFFSKYDWPGNVRELKNTIEGAYYAAEGNKIKFADVKERFLERHDASEEEVQITDDFFESGLTLKEYIEKRMKDYITETLNKHDGVLRDTAKTLGLSTQMLKYNMKKYGIEE